MELKIKSLSDINRIKILTALKITPLCISELSEVLGLSQPNTSKHIKLLLAEGIVEYIKLGKYRYYFIDFDHYNEHYYIESLIGYYKVLEEGVKFEDAVYNLISSDEIEKRKIISNEKDEEVLKFIDIRDIDKLDFDHVIDIREPIEYKMQHIAGIRNEPLSKLNGRLEMFLSKNIEYYIICQADTRSRFLARTMINEGFKAVVVLRGMDGYYS